MLECETKVPDALIAEKAFPYLSNKLGLKQHLQTIHDIGRKNFFSSFETGQLCVVTSTSYHIYIQLAKLGRTTDTFHFWVYDFTFRFI